MNDQPQGLPLSPAIMQDQREHLIEDHDYDEEEAEEVFRSVKTFVMLSAQELEEDWTDEEINAMSNILLGIQHQQEMMMEQQQQERSILPKIFAAIVTVATAGVFLYAGWLMSTGEMQLAALHGLIGAVLLLIR